MEYHYKRLPSVSESKRGAIEASTVNFDFYHNQFIKESKIVKTKDDKGKEIEILKWKSAEKLDILKRNIIADLEQNLINNEFFYQSYHQWWTTLYSKATFYRYKKEAMQKFLGAFYGS